MESLPIERRLPSFWPLQLGGWAAYAAANMAALIPSRHAQDYVAYRTMYLTVGFLGSFLMYPFCHWLRRVHIAIIRSLAACAIVGYLLAIPASMAITWAEIRFGGAKVGLRWETVLANAVGVAFVYVTWSAFYFGIKHYQDSEQHRARLQASEAFAREAQLCALRYQLQPHFLFNTLNAISTLILADKRKTATQMIARLGTLLRMTLDSPHTHEISLDEELATAEEYLQIEQIRFGRALRVSYRIQNEARQLLVPRFLLQPLVENAIRHGIARRRDGGQITICAERDPGMLKIVVENEVDATSVPSAEQMEDRERHGLGLSNTRLRLRQLYGEDGVVETRLVANSLFQVTVWLPAGVSDERSHVLEVRA